MDPVSIGLLLASLASSTAGGVMNANAKEKDYENQLKAQTAQTQMQTDEAKVANDVLQQYQGRNAGYIANDQSAFKTALDPYAPGAQAATTAANEARRGDAISANINAGTTGAPALKDTDSPAVAKAFDDAIATKLGQSKANGAALAKLGAIGDTWQGNTLSENQANRDIGTTNTIARDDAANLPAAQQLASFQQKKIIQQAAPTDETAGNLLIGLGNLGSTIAGAGIGKGGTGTINVSSLWNPIKGISGS